MEDDAKSGVRVEGRGESWRARLAACWKGEEIFKEFCEHLDAELDTREIDRVRDHGGRVGEHGERDHQGVAYLKEYALIQEMGQIELVARIQTLRQNLKAMMTREDYDDFIPVISTLRSKLMEDAIASAASVPLQPKGRKLSDRIEDILKEEATALLDRTYRRYVLIPQVEKQRIRISAAIIASVIIVSVVLVVGLLIYKMLADRAWGETSIVYITALIAGALGATVSTMKRLHDLDMRRDPLLLWLNMGGGWGSLCLSPIIGALFGLLFLLFMRSEVVTGVFLPDFSPSVWNGMHFNFRNCPGEPEHCGHVYKDFAWIIVWTFAAGWAERLVPDVLDRLSRQAAAVKRASTAKY